jgi:hypothetical protein
MNIILIFFIFVVILFLYIHILFHLKTNDDLEIYELNLFSKERLNEVCDLRQPIIFNYDIDNLLDFKIDNILNQYFSFDIKIKIYENNNSNILSLNFSDAIQIIQNYDDKDSKNYIIENNKEFLEETTLFKKIQFNDDFFKPQGLFYYDYDYRNYFILIEGKVKLKLTPPKNYKYLNIIHDYEYFKFYSKMNVWDPDINDKNNFNKIKFLELELIPGNVIYIPAYWIYSFKFIDKKSTILSFKYTTYMNNLSILPQLTKSFLQKQNIKHNFYKKFQSNNTDDIKIDNN